MKGLNFMAYKLEIYTGNKNYMAPAGTIYTPELLEKDFPALKVFPHIIQTDSKGQVCFAVLNLAATRDQYDIDPSLTDAKAVKLIEEKMNTPVEETPSAEERIAAALEYQNVLSM